MTPKPWSSAAGGRGRHACVLDSVQVLSLFDAKPSVVPEAVVDDGARRVGNPVGAERLLLLQRLRRPGNHVGSCEHTSELGGSRHGRVSQMGQAGQDELFRAGRVALSCGNMEVNRQSSLGGPSVKCFVQILSPPMTINHKTNSSLS